MKLWDKGFATNEEIEQFTVGNDRELDIRLAKYDVISSKAHARMLANTGLISNKDKENLLKGLDKIEAEIKSGKFTIEKEFEDVHSKIEFELTKDIGEAGKKIHTARSRNDQVLTALQLYYKDEIYAISKIVKQLFEILIELSDKNKNNLMPGYTHTQIAMPSSFGLLFSAYAESLIDDIIQLTASLRIIDQNPLGSAAGYGSSFPINRTLTTNLLGFKHLKYNSIASQMNRGKIEKSLGFALESISGTISKMANDLITFMNPNYGFVKLPKEFTTGSSIMPHKQNPDVLEIIRGSSNKVQSLANEIHMITGNLGTGYHRDFQLLKEPVFKAIDIVKQNLKVFSWLLPKLEIKKYILNDKLYANLFSVEEINRLVRDGIPFRDAYKIVSRNIIENKFNPDQTVQHTHEGSIGNLCLEEIKEKFYLYYNLIS